MRETTLKELLTLEELSIQQLIKRYQELFEIEKNPTNNRTFLIRRIAYRIQELEYGGLSEEVLQKVDMLIEEHDPINAGIVGKRQASFVKEKGWDTRLPIPGTIIRREYKGKLLEVKVLEKGFEYKGKTYRSLTSIVKKVTGSHWNGYVFFNL